MKNNQIPLLILIVALLGAGWLGVRSAINEELVGGGSGALSASAFTSQESFFDFGTVQMDDGIVTHDFVLQNNGPEPLVIDRVYTSCMCTDALLIESDKQEKGPYGMHTKGRANVLVPRGESVTVRARFDPAAHGPSGIGLAERTIYLETNSETKPNVELNFKAMVVR